jgi:hypothetical protein
LFYPLSAPICGRKSFPLISLMFADLFALSSFCAHLRHLRKKKLPADFADVR